MTVLREAYEMIRDEGAWCTGTLATNDDGLDIAPHDPKATRHCAMGAVHAARFGQTWPGRHWRYDEATAFGREVKALEDAARALFPQYEDLPDMQPVVKINDELGHEAIMQVFEKAIVELEGTL